MAERKPLSKKLRFEVFKRDAFTCQYCGKKAPDVVLEVDHIKPVSKGGKDELLNLVTACFDCNRGKRNIELSDDTAVKKQQNQLQELAELKEQLDMMLEWRSGLCELENDYVEAVADVFGSGTHFDIPSEYKTEIRKWIKRFGFDEVILSIDISKNTYYDGSLNSFKNAFEKVGGICFNRKKEADEKRINGYADYAVITAINNGIICDHEFFTRSESDQIREYFLLYVRTEDDFKKAKVFLDNSAGWGEFWRKMETVFKNDYWG